VELTLETRGMEHARQLEAALREGGFTPVPERSAALGPGASRRRKAPAQRARRAGARG
jgi:hypothetical protein